MKQIFNSFAAKASTALGSIWAFLVAVCMVIVWAMFGPVFHYSETWQMVVNTGTTIITFLMVFLIQNSQNRAEKAIQKKLDELIRSSDARNDLIGLEQSPNFEA